MASKQWWTVSAVYDDNEQSYVDHFEAKTWQDAWKKALHKADGVIRKSAIFAGKLNAVDFDEANSVVPIRGKAHTIEVANVRITARHVVVPGRCPKCKKDLRRANALVETYLVAHQWRAHLSHNEQDISGERDGAIGRDDAKIIDAARLACSACGALIWDGFHVD
jgi:hypothetical protein